MDDKHKRYILMLDIKDKLNRLSGTEFERFFLEIMKKFYGNDFIMPSSYGKYGDGKNDGYILSKGSFFALYGPTTNNLNCVRTIKKMDDDYNKLLEKQKAGVWTTKVESWTFVINLKNLQKVPQPLAISFDKLKNLAQNRDKVNIFLWIQDDIINFIENKLTIEQIKSLTQLNFFQFDDISNIEIDANIMSKVIEGIIKNSLIYVGKQQIKKPKKFNQKIKLNNLNYENEIKLSNAFLQFEQTAEIIKSFGTDAADIIGDFLSDLYNKAKSYHKCSDEIFKYLFVKMYGEEQTYDNTMAKLIHDAKIAILARYFENCTIFESSEIAKEHNDDNSSTNKKC